jgi:hypothetical protein
MTTKLTMPALTAAAALMLTPHVFAQETGVSHPETLNDSVSVAPDAPAHYVKPSPDVPMAPAPQAATPVLHPREALADDSEYHPLNSPLQTASVHPIDNSLIVTDDINSGIVGEAPTGPNELATGTLLKAKLVGTISTRETVAESRFTATLTAPVIKHGRIMLPVGTQVNGRVTQIRGGHRAGGPAAIHLQPDIVKLPSGMAYELEAQVIDLDDFSDAHVNTEGTIVGNDHPGITAAKIGGTAGGGAIVGAMVGGGVGAVVGATIGAGVGTIWWLKQDRQQTLEDGTHIIFSLDSNLNLTPVAR